MLAAWLAEDHAVVLAVGRHNETSEDVYVALLDRLDLAAPSEEREKPPCCDEEGLPPVDLDLATAIVEAIGHRRHRP